MHGWKLTKTFGAIYTQDPILQWSEATDMDFGILLCRV